MGRLLYYLLVKVGLVFILGAEADRFVVLLMCHGRICGYINYFSRQNACLYDLGVKAG